MAAKSNPLFILFSIFPVISSFQIDYDCVYTVYVRTGSCVRAGTNSVVTLSLYNATGFGIRINNLATWAGLMGPNHDYFEQGNLDIFSGRGPCLTGPICAMNLTSDGTGEDHGWYCDYVEVTAVGVHRQCTQISFKVERWLASYAVPFRLSAIQNWCGWSSGKKESLNDVSDLNLVTLN